MADNLLLPLSGRVILDSNGKPVSGAKLEVFDAGTNNQKSVYSDASLLTTAENPIVANVNGVVPVRYLGLGAWKVTFSDSDGATLTNHTPWDHIPGAIDTTSFLVGTIAPSRSSVSKTANYTTVNATDNGKQINCDATGGDFTITLDAATVGDGKDYVVKNTGESGSITVDDGSDGLVLAPLDSATFRSDGATWQIVEAYNATGAIRTIAYAATVTPDLVGPNGDNYKITLTGNITVNNPTSVRPGTMGTFTVIQNATGGHAVTLGANFKGSIDFDTAADGVTLFGFHARSATDIDVWPLKGEPAISYISAIVRDEKSSGSGGGTPGTAGSYHKSDLNTLSGDNDSRSVTSLTSNVIAMKPGTYRIKARKVFVHTGTTRIRVRDTTNSETLGEGISNSTGGASAGSEVTVGTDKFTLSAAANIELQYYTATNPANGLGAAVSTGQNELYAELEIHRYI